MKSRPRNFFSSRGCRANSPPDPSSLGLGSVFSSFVPNSSSAIRSNASGGVEIQRLAFLELVLEFHFIGLQKLAANMGEFSFVHMSLSVVIAVEDLS